MNIQTGLYYTSEAGAEPVEIQINDIVEFRFQDVMQKGLEMSDFGKLLEKHKIERCFFHFKWGKDLFPDYGWPTVLMYPVYLIKEDRLFKEGEDEESDEPFPNPDNYNFCGQAARFLVYLSRKKSFYPHGHSIKSMLSLEDLMPELVDKNS